MIPTTALAEVTCACGRVHRVADHGVLRTPVAGNPLGWPWLRCSSCQRAVVVGPPDTDTGDRFPPGKVCECGTVVRRFDENADRIRTIEVCTTCGEKRYGVFAKRFDEEGREAWGSVGRWSISLARGAPS